MTTSGSSRASIPRARSWADIACSAFIWTFQARPKNGPRLCFGSTATEGWKPVSIRNGPALGCSTRKATIGSSSTRASACASP